MTHQLSPARLGPIQAALAGFPSHYFQGKNVLVTGARGYFGRYVVEAFVYLNEVHNLGISIHALDSDALGTNDDWADWAGARGVAIHKHNVRHQLDELCRVKLDYIIHLAGIASPHWYKQLPLETIDVAVEGTRQTLELAREHKAHFLFSSSSEVYQTAEVIPTPEHYVGAIPSTNDRSCYDVSKLMAETLCYVYATKYDVHATVVRIFNSFGPGMQQSDRRILTRIAEAVKHGKQVLVYMGKGGVENLPRRTYTPVANTLRGVLYALVKGVPFVGPARGVYNVGSTEPELSVPELMDLIHATTGLPTSYMFQPAPQEYHTEPQRRCPDISALRTLGYTPAMSLEDGLRGFFAWSQQVYV